MLQHKIYNKVVLVVLDGFGVATYSRGNAVGLAQTPNFNSLVANYPSLTLQASGPLVGLPWGEMGNSEVGHLNMGAGRITALDLPKINAAIQSGEFFKNAVLLKAIEHVKEHNSKLHLIGMVSNGNVHSSDEHLYALMGLAKENGLDQTYIHMFTDGRDTAQKYALEALGKLNSKITEVGIGTIASVTGRFYGMDRGGHWNQTQMTYEVLVEGKGQLTDSPQSAILNSYNEAVYDEMIKPTVITTDGTTPVAKIGENDAVIFFNFRQDRALQLTQAFVDPSLINHPNEKIPGLFFVTMTEYIPGLAVEVAFPSESLVNNLAEVISNAGKKQFHVAESEKYAHVTSFFNCGIHDALQGEERLIVKSPDDNKNYELHPQMSAEKVTNELIKKIEQPDVNFLLANFANGDMVGHTGSLTAATEAVNFLDVCIGRIVEAVLKQDAVLIVSADHGNCERMLDTRTGEIDKDHTTNPVPCLIIANELKFAQPKDLKLISLAARVPDGVISDIAATVLDLFGIVKPKEMTAVNLLTFL